MQRWSGTIYLQKGKRHNANLHIMKEAINLHSIEYLKKERW